MKVITGLLSFYVLIILSIEFFESSDTHIPSKNSANQEVFVKPSILKDKLLSVEKRWNLMKSERKNESFKETPVSDEEYKLKIGHKNYQLYGILNQGNSSFIVLKGENSVFITLREGDVLEDNFNLVAIDNNKISFENKNERFEFKLFERKNHANN